MGAAGKTGWCLVHSLSVLVPIFVTTPLGQNLANAFTYLGWEICVVADNFVTFSCRIGLGAFTQHAQSLSQQGHLPLEAPAVGAQPEMESEAPAFS